MVNVNFTYKLRSILDNMGERPPSCVNFNQERDFTDLIGGGGGGEDVKQSLLRVEPSTDLILYP